MRTLQFPELDGSTTVVCNGHRATLRENADGWYVRHVVVVGTRDGMRETVGVPFHYTTKAGALRGIRTACGQHAASLGPINPDQSWRWA